MSSKEKEYYRERLKQNYINLESLLSLKVNHDTSKISIDRILEMAQKEFRYFNEQSKVGDATGNNLLLRLESSIAEVSMISEACSFLAIPVLDFSYYDRKDYLLELLLEYRSFNDLDLYVSRSFREVVEYMIIIERSYSEQNVRKSIGYKTIRNFLMLLVGGKYVHASVYATFLKDQLFLSCGLSPRIQFSENYHNELTLEMRKERDRFSKKVTKAMFNGLKNVASKKMSDVTNSVSNIIEDSKRAVDHKIKVATGQRFDDYYDDEEFDNRERRNNYREPSQRVNPRVRSNPTIRRTDPRDVYYPEDIVDDYDRRKRPSRVYYDEEDDRTNYSRTRVGRDNPNNRNTRKSGVGSSRIFYD